MTREEITKAVQEAFQGHSVAVVGEKNTENMQLYRVMISGNSFSLDDFYRLSMIDYDIRVLVESNVLTLTLFKQV